MPLRRISDYTGIATWTISLVFVLGTIYAQQKENTKAIKDAQIYKQQITALREDTKSLKLQQSYQKEWQSEFMATFKEMVKEIKVTNAEVLRNTYHLQSIDDKLKG